MHFPQLSAGQTLAFAAAARAPKVAQQALGRDTYLQGTMNAVTKSLRLSGNLNTLVGNDIIPGVSGGERKRVSIAEILCGNSMLQCWDNSTRGLDSGNAWSFVLTLKKHTSLMGSTAFVSLYQASDTLYKVHPFPSCVKKLV